MSRQGRHGELKFAEICTRSEACAEAVINKANDDQYGWDYVVEIVPPRIANLPADLQAHVVQCFAQIKTTCGSKPTTKLKLSNAIKAAKSSLPSFVFLLKYVDGNDSPTIYGRHVWKNEIFYWLKRARETESTERHDLHNLTVSMSFTEADRLSANPVDWILHILDSLGDAYSSKKHDLVRSVGYDESALEGKVRFDSLDSIGDIVSLELGLIKDLPVANFKVYDNRFGIKSNAPIHEFFDSRMSISSEGRVLTLQLESENGKTFDIPATMMTPQSVDLDHQEFKFRLKAGHIEIIGYPNKENQHFNWQCDLDKRFSLVDQIGFLCLLNWSQEGRVEFHFLAEEGRLLSGKFHGSAENKPWMFPVERVGHRLIDILGIERSKKLNISYYELYEISRPMLLISSILAGDKFKIEANDDGEFEPFKKLIGYYYGQIDGWAFCFLCEVECDAYFAEGTRQSFDFSNAKIFRKWVFKQSLTRAKEQIVTEFEKFKKAQSVPVAVFQEGDIAAWSQALLDGSPVSVSVS